MSAEPDILRIDSVIKERFQKAIKSAEQLKKDLKLRQKLSEANYLTPATIEKLKEECGDLEKRIENIVSGNEFNFYLSESAPFIEEYKLMLATPEKRYFMKKKKSGNSKEKSALVDKYLNIAQRYVISAHLEKEGDVRPIIPVVDRDNEKKKVRKIKCTCNNKKDFEIDEGGIYTCMVCGEEQHVPFYTTSYKDVDRVNISSKYTYDRIIHFRDSMNQYQGKQNSTIDPKVYTDLEEQFRKHHLLVGDESTPPFKKFSKITKSHISMFLKELKYTKHYENVNLIHFKLTGIPPDDISHLEDKLMEDFIKLTDLYDQIYIQEKKINRKNFINTHYVLYQLLCRHKHPCNKEDFNILKTIDRQHFHDDVTRDLFTRLNWNHVSLL